MSVQGQILQAYFGLAEIRGHQASSVRMTRACADLLVGELSVMFGDAVGYPTMFMGLDVEVVDEPGEWYELIYRFDLREEKK